MSRSGRPNDMMAPQPPPPPTLNLRVDPGDVLNFGIQWQGCQYLDALAAFGWVHGSRAFQMMSNAIAYVMAQQGYKMFPYIDDYILVMHGQAGTSQIMPFSIWCIF